MDETSDRCFAAENSGDFLRLRTLKVVTLVLGLLPGCVRQMVRANPGKTPDQDIVYLRGQAVVRSAKAHSEVAIEPVGGPTGRYEMSYTVAFMVGVKNLSAARIEVSEDSVSVLAQNQPAYVFKATQLEDQIRNAQASAQFMNALAAGVEMGAVKGALARHVIAQDAAQEAAAIQDKAMREQASLSAILQRTTLDPQGSIVGTVVIYAPRTGACGEGWFGNSEGLCNWTISVRVGEDVHTFSFNESR